MYKTTWRHFDVPLFLVTIALVIVGGVMIYSAFEASIPQGDRAIVENTVYRQAIFAAVGFVVYLFFAALDYHVLMSLSRWIYLFSIGVLAITLLLGNIRFGSQSWIQFELFDVQPSELSKVLMVVVVARVLGDDKRRLDSLGPFALSLLLLVPPVLLIYFQPDFGTALILAITWLGMCFLAGVRWQHMFLLACLAAVIMPLTWFQLQDYMRERIIAFLFPGQDPSGASYNINQALISIGSGGFWGKGLLRGTQSQLHFLRVRHTDFIFSVLAEELGLVGSVLVLAAFAFLVLRLLRIASLAPDRHGRLIVAGVAAMILAQAVINLGMNANLLPVTGLPLPLVSYGGSSLITTLLALGLAQSVAMRAQPERNLIA